MNFLFLKLKRIYIFYVLKLMAHPVLKFKCQLAAGGRRWLRVFREEAAGDVVFGSQLLRRVRQRRGNDVRR